jgi:acetamidase/formamidase
MSAVVRELGIDATRVHHCWDSSLDPTLIIRSGDRVRFELLMAGHGQVRLGDEYADTAFDWDTLYNLLGPIWVEGAALGDTLEVEVLSLQPGPWGWTAVLPELGLLPDDFPEPYLRTFEFGDRARIEFAPGVGVPVAPFLGTMGTHPGGEVVQPPFPPHRGGGNIDNRHLREGASLFLPIWCQGALFSCGDPHAAQGDGEVCVSAVECAMSATLAFRLHKRSIPTPMFFVDDDRLPRERDGYFGTMGIAPDLMEGARIAVRGMIDWLVDQYDLTREDAYVLASLAGDLKLHEVVDAGMWNVGFTLPQLLFDEPLRARTLC